MTGLAELIRRTRESWPPGVEIAVFGTSDPDVIERSMVGVVEVALAQVSEAIFYKAGVGVVAGLRLADGREVVIKVHRWNVTVDRLRAVQRVLAHLADRGMPAPRPLMAPRPTGNGVATVEELLPAGRAAGHDPAVRRACAEGLRRLVDAAIDSAEVAELDPPALLRPPPAALWFEPHDLRFDFVATAPGAEWIDDLAREGRRHLNQAGPLPPVVGHFDWRVENLGFDGGRIVGIFDSDSFAIASEAILVGNTAAIFTSDWDSDDPDPLPSLAEMKAFVEEYEGVRGRPFTPAELQVLDAANLLACAYGARCQHSDMQRHPELGLTPDVAWFRLLRQRGPSAWHPRLAPS